MTVIFDGEIHVHYRFINLTVDDDLPDLSHASGGQRNGLCGAAEPGALAMITGLHTGPVPFTMTWHDTEPPPADDWEEVVEVPFEAASHDVTLSAFEESHQLRLPATGSLRARYCATGMEEATDLETPVDRYLLQLWPAAPAPDAILRETSRSAAYWHGVAQETPPPPTQAERAAARAAEEQKKAAQQAQWAAERERREWGGVAPTPRLRELTGNARTMAATHRDLLDDLALLPAPRQREIARWLAREAFTHAGLTDDPQAVAALDALDRDVPLPPPFTDLDAAFAHLHPDPTRLIASSRFVRPDDPPPPRYPIHRPSFAIPALFGATEDDPLQAVVEAFTHTEATYEDRAADLVAALRARFLV
ncbi:hypothetical protein [Actinoplanes sp. NBRC 103695]|uniref:hypothetical protein n=1 Tax=Actinoplanes sp. NBRC 103695 TaxID=3032202 RepID=UPI0024A2BA68|nr:hypothetical protein [Actinoplanes sp. NBRC 103695]GLY99945.1 hypothetical protein Acsp02_71980 [Actinoplanes sp. NBRC 103695]